MSEPKSACLTERLMFLFYTQTAIQQKMFSSVSNLYMICLEGLVELGLGAIELYWIWLSQNSIIYINILHLVSWVMLVKILVGLGLVLNRKYKLVLCFVLNSHTSLNNKRHIKYF